MKTSEEKTKPLSAKGVAAAYELGWDCGRLLDDQKEINALHRAMCEALKEYWQKHPEGALTKVSQAFAKKEEECSSEIFELTKKAEQLPDEARKHFNSAIGDVITLSNLRYRAILEMALPTA